ncbi:hypothetical protein KY290_031103 [Solanum tuberosum]|uniref:Reverse transcriptase Ty1/copia-type domain-containing protein n=1 Tax=Solanum tuberosum TaxID=4113 RepID=A0ABQ7U881_SOLTU|nr:hypothetical protein KY290_031103 [Solanum tuberosum]
MGFIKFEFDASLFILKNLAATIYVLIYVDYILIMGSHPILIRYVIESLGSQFSLKDLGYLDYILGVEVKKVQDGLILSQSKYILDILSDLDMKDYKGVLTPMCSGKLPQAIDGSPPANVVSTGAPLEPKFKHMWFLSNTLMFVINLLIHLSSPCQNQPLKGVVPSEGLLHHT